VGEIQTFTEPRQWLHVPGVINPADIGTRPISITELRDCQFWWEGPAFLRSEISDWPKLKIVQELESKELKQTIFLSTEHLKKVDFDLFTGLHPRHFSVSKFANGLGKCLIKWGHILKVKQLFLMQKEDRPIRQSKLLRHTDIEDAQIFIAKQSQLEFFGKEIALMSKNLRPMAEIRGNKSSQILKFNPFLDPSGILRSRSRLTNIPGLTYDKAHPIILH
jgi:hypothetical protein